MNAEIPGSVKGDLIVIHRGLYQHYAVNVGNGEIIHITPTEGLTSLDFASGIARKLSSTSSNIASIKKERFDVVFGAEVEFSVERDETPFSPDEIVNRAYSKLGKVGYDLLCWNCEHFARWCRYNRRESHQVYVTVSIAVILVLFVVIVTQFSSNQKRS